MIHKIINSRSYLQEIDNIFNMTQKPCQPKRKYNLVGLVIKARDMYYIQQSSGQFRCGECSDVFGRPVYHPNNTCLDEFLIKPLIVRHSKDLNEMNAVI
jgi:hypothetical protein